MAHEALEEGLSEASSAFDVGNALLGELLTMGVTSQRCFFLSDGKYQYPVHVQGLDRSAPGGCQTQEIDTLPSEMFMPRIASWVK
jgi:hypothetical protein